MTEESGKQEVRQLHPASRDQLLAERPPHLRG